MSTDRSLPDTVLTAETGLVLTRLLPDDAEAYLRLMRDNREHLTRHGDFEEQLEATVAATRAAFARHPEGGETAYGIRAQGRLVGGVSLVAVDPPRYGIGYWLDRSATGRGYMTAACEALLEQARRSLEATDFYAGVTHGNTESEAVLRRLGFTAVAGFDTYTRFHRQ